MEKFKSMMKEIIRKLIASLAKDKSGTKVIKNKMEIIGHRKVAEGYLT